MIKKSTVCDICTQKFNDGLSFLPFKYSTDKMKLQLGVFAGDSASIILMASNEQDICGNCLKKLFKIISEEQFK